MSTVFWLDNSDLKVVGAPEKQTLVQILSFKLGILFHICSLQYLPQ